MRALNLLTYMQHEYSRIYDCSEYTTAEHFPMLFMICTELVKNKWRTCSVDQGRSIYCKDGFARGGHNYICKCVRADTFALCISVRADTIAYAKPSRGHYCICNIVLRIVLHRGHACMRHRLYVLRIPIGFDRYPFSRAGEAMSRGMPNRRGRPVVKR